MKLGNYFNFVLYFDKLPTFQRELILIISQNYLAESESPHIIKVLLPNSASKTVCDQIYLILLLNQLPHLTVESILNYAIKNRGKIFWIWTNNY